MFWIKRKEYDKYYGSEDDSQISFYLFKFVFILITIGLLFCLFAIALNIVDFFGW